MPPLLCSLFPALTFLTQCPPAFPQSPFSPRKENHLSWCLNTSYCHVGRRPCALCKILSGNDPSPYFLLNSKTRRPPVTSVSLGRLLLGILRHLTYVAPTRVEQTGFFSPFYNVESPRFLHLHPHLCHQSTMSMQDCLLVLRLLFSISSCLSSCLPFSTVNDPVAKAVHFYNLNGAYTLKFKGA